MSDAIARYYDPSKNPDGGMLPGVPLANLTEAQYDALPTWLQASVDASPMYRKTPIKPTAAPADKD